MEGATLRHLADGRVHFCHGPIDLLITADGPADAVAAAIDAASCRFATVLDELVAELPALRTTDAEVTGPIARAMASAVRPHQSDGFVTPMAAVAGAVADAVLAAMTDAAPLDRAIVNNGGDIALHLAPHATAKARIALADGGTLGTVTICGNDAVRGIATSGRHGRSFSLGIADSVTVLGASAAAADVAATLIANHVDLPGHRAVTRVAAETLDPDTDLRGKLVTTACAPLAPAEVAAALTRGAAAASAMVTRGLADAAALHLQGRWRAVGPTHPIAMHRAQG